LDTDIAATMAAITQSKHKINFFNHYTEDPVNFIRKFVASQSADLSSLAAERNNGKGPEWTKGGSDSIWASEAARENVGQVLARKPPA
jgi:SWI/SNF-related matrix-associated actin-dependent regulator of chromatin subfamily D